MFVRVKEGSFQHTPGFKIQNELAITDLKPNYLSSDYGSNVARA
jgi:hypothetical protein